MNPADVVQKQLDSYNAHDIEAFSSCFAHDVVLGALNGAVTNVGVGSVRERYDALFTHFPQNHATLLHRVVVGNVVIDHEEIRRKPDAEPFRVAMIYTIEHGLIARADVLREEKP